MATCEELESQILDRVAGTLPAVDTVGLEAHLAGCPRCRSWKASCEEAVRLYALPAPSEAERSVFAHLPARARAAFRERARRGSRGLWLAAATGVAGLAVLLLVAAPWQPGREKGLASEGAGAEELVAWALADPLEDEAVFANEGDPAEVDDELIDPGRGLDLDLEETE